MSELMSRRGWRRWSGEFNHRIGQDLLLAALFGFAGFALSAHFDAFERFGAFSRRHEAWQLDEVASVVALATIAALIFAVRRTLDARRELKGRKEAEAIVLQMAHHDPLTGLANRRKLGETLTEALRLPKELEETTALLLVDLDRFKPVNDTHGHAIGDRLLTQVGERLKNCVRDGELVGRFGGDEFAVLLPRASGAEAVSRPARRILQTLARPFQIDHLTVHIGASIGAAMSADTAFDSEALIHNADLALYRAKREGRGQFRFFEDFMDSEIRAQARLETGLRQAIIDGSIVPYYQPLVDISTGEIKGYELLARWIHAEEGIIPPATFIPIAEDTGLIGEMSLSLLRQACLDAQGWPGTPILAVNVSPVQLQDAFLPKKLLAVLGETGFEPRRLEVEITENALVGDFEAAKRILLELKAHGVQIALDDFGTGYSSLNHLRALPFDILKIDRSFIHLMGESDENRKIVDAIVGLSHSLGLVTVAEGIEDAEEIVRLKELGCQLGQGFFYGRPSPDVGGFEVQAETA